MRTGGCGANAPCGTLQPLLLQAGHQAEDTVHGRVPHSLHLGYSLGSVGVATVDIHPLELHIATLVLDILHYLHCLLIIPPHPSSGIACVHLDTHKIRFRDTKPFLQLPSFTTSGYLNLIHFCWCCISEFICSAMFMPVAAQATNLKPLPWGTQTMVCPQEEGWCPGSGTSPWWWPSSGTPPASPPARSPAPGGTGWRETHRGCHQTQHQHTSHTELCRFSFWQWNIR